MEIYFLDRTLCISDCIDWSTIKIITSLSVRCTAPKCCIIYLQRFSLTGDERFPLLFWGECAKAYFPITGRQLQRDRQQSMEQPHEWQWHHTFQKLLHQTRAWNSRYGMLAPVLPLLAECIRSQSYQCRKELPVTWSLIQYSEYRSRRALWLEWEWNWKLQSPGQPDKDDERKLWA